MTEVIGAIGWTSTGKLRTVHNKVTRLRQKSTVVDRRFGKLSAPLRIPSQGDTPMRAYDGAYDGARSAVMP